VILFPLFSTGEVTPGVLCLTVGFPVQKRNGHTGKSPRKGHKDVEGILSMHTNT